MFSGSYHPDDVTILLKPIQLAPTPVAEKERLIQSGVHHYSEMISAENLPSPRYVQVFEEALTRNKARFGHHLRILANMLRRTRRREITLVSLARAGTPIGVLLTRILRKQVSVRVQHYAVSIIRDRGIDEVALRYILARHSPESVAFVDGWTGKGLIARELHTAIRGFNQRTGVTLDPGLFTVADLCGQAAVAATADDYLLPSCVLGATINGLISRSILNREVLGPDDFHGCLFYEEFAVEDRSRWFLDVMMEEIERQQAVMPEVIAEGVSELQRDACRRINEAFLAEWQRREGIQLVQHIKPGIGEATRVLLRRVPDRLLLRDPASPEVAPLRLLAEEKAVPIVIVPDLPYRAAALIKELEP